MRARRHRGGVGAGRVGGGALNCWCSKLLRNAAHIEVERSEFALPHCPLQTKYDIAKPHSVGAWPKTSDRLSRSTRPASSVFGDRHKRPIDIGHVTSCKRKADAPTRTSPQSIKLSLTQPSRTSADSTQQLAAVSPFVKAGAVQFPLLLAPLPSDDGVDYSASRSRHSVAGATARLFGPKLRRAVWLLAGSSRIRRNFMRILRGET